MTCEAVSTKLAYLFGTVTTETAYDVLVSLKEGETHFTSPSATTRESVSPPKKSSFRAPIPQNSSQNPGKTVETETETDESSSIVYTNPLNFVRLSMTPPPVELHDISTPSEDADKTVEPEKVTVLIEYLLQRSLRGEVSDSAMAISMKNMFSDLGHTFPNMDHIDH